MSSSASNDSPGEEDPFTPDALEETGPSLADGTDEITSGLSKTKEGVSEAAAGLALLLVAILIGLAALFNKDSVTEGR